MCAERNGSAKTMGSNLSSGNRGQSVPTLGRLPSILDSASSASFAKVPLKCLTNSPHKSTNSRPSPQVLSYNRINS
jgi:hypothetical protein